MRAGFNGLELDNSFGGCFNLDAFANSRDRIEHNDSDKAPFRIHRASSRVLDHYDLTIGRHIGVCGHLCVVIVLHYGHVELVE